MKPILSAAYKLLEDSQITKLPLTFEDVISIISKNGWEVYAYSEATEFFESMQKVDEGITKFIEERNGFTIFDNRQTMIFFRDNLSYQEKIFVLCHEIGHIVLKHTYFGVLGNNPSSAVSQVQETEADKFALELNAPLPILNQLHIKSYKDIYDMGLLSEARSKQQFLEYIISKDRIAYSVSSEEELQLCEQFHDLIKQQKRKSKKTHLYKAAWAVFFVILISVCSIFLYSLVVHPPVQTDPPTSELPATATYYWTDGGEVFHYYSDCQALAHSNDIQSGNLEEAEAEKDRLCKFCEDRMKSD